MTDSSDVVTPAPPALAGGLLDPNVDPKKLSGRERLDYLLQQSDIFSHYMSGGGKSKKGGKGGNSPWSPSSKSPGKGTGGRHTAGRMSEKDEDDDLIRQAASGGSYMRLEKQPPSINGEMRSYQLEGLNWLISLYHNGINGILADEMGLGKTLQSISIMVYLKDFLNITGPHLVIGPKSVLGNWHNECKKFAPSVRAKRFHGSKDERPRIKAEEFQPGQFDVMITTYETAIAEKGFLSKIKWQYLIIDEAHRIKNENSLLSRVLRTFETRNRLLITGTPLQNNLHELWSMLNFILPKLFSSADDFDDWFDTSKDIETDVIHRLHKLLRPFLLRRLKIDVEKTLKPKKEVRLYIPMADLQRNTYKSILERNISALNDVGASRVQMLNIVMQLRKCCNHPYLFDGIEQPPFITDERLVNTAGKMTVLDRLLPRLQANGDRVLIFCQMTRLLDILEDYFLWKGYKYCRLDGSTSGEDRDRQMQEYNEPGSEKFIFMLSTRAGGLGINLYTANIVILYDSDWNPQADLQAMDRAHRIGQTKQVTVYRFISDNTVEEGVVRKAQKKRMLDQVVIQQGKLQDKNKPISKDEMLGMVKRGAQDILNSNSGPTEEQMDIEKILEESLKRTQEEDDEMKKQLGDSKMNFTFDGSGMYEFEGENFKDKKDKFQASFIALPKREHKKSSYNDSAYFKEMLAGQKKASAKPKLPKLPELYKFQFHDSKRLNELRSREVACFEKVKDLHASCERSGTWETYEADKTKLEEEHGLTEEETDEVQRLLAGGFSTWNKRDFYNFTKACERFGRDDIEGICSAVEDKDPEEVRRYHTTFFARIKEVDGYEKILERIEKTEERKRRVDVVRKLLEDKVGKHKSDSENWHNLIQIPQSVSSKRGYIDENDRFLLIEMYKLGYGDDNLYNKIQMEIRNSPMFRFDYYFKSRNADDLKKRAETLVRAMEKEEEEKNGEVKKRSRTSNSNKSEVMANGHNDEATASKKSKS